MKKKFQLFIFEGMAFLDKTALNPNMCNQLK